MTIITLEDLAAQIKPGKPVAGLDLGTKTIGFAISDIGWRLANPKLVIKRSKFTKDAEELQRHLRSYDICAIVIGLPANMDGTEGPRAQATRAFVRNMEKLTNLPFVFEDERLSTVAAEWALLEMDVSRAKRKERIDAAAAAIILQGALDRLARLSSPTAGV
ncbi:MAG: Holliday junction resolvase RuvX [Rhizobiaceae bacterium]